jgi:7-cyano-7-deazaguanine synthase
MKSEAPPGPRRAVVLLSGGLDSATALAIAKEQGFEPFALTIRYGQRHAAEIAAARRVAAELGATKHIELEIDLRAFGGSALTADIDVPKQRTDEDMAEGIPITYVPARNTVFLSLSLAWAEALGAFDVFIGVNALDYSGYPDCRPEFVAAFESLANLATKAGVKGTGHFRVHAPLVSLTKAQIIRKGTELGIDYAMTSSCYDPDSVTGLACGECDSCLLRARGFRDAGVSDPTRYCSTGG